MLFVVLDMVHSNMFPKAIMRMDVTPDKANDYVKLGDRLVFVEVDVSA